MCLALNTLTDGYSASDAVLVDGRIVYVGDRFVVSYQLHAID